jgi:hypothetical protein
MWKSHDGRKGCGYSLTVGKLWKPADGREETIETTCWCRNLILMAEGM